MSGELVIMSLEDVERILCMLYQGSRPPRVRYLVCGCGRVANFEIGDAQAIGWQLLPNVLCPRCCVCPPYEGPEARERYLALVEKLLT